MNHRSQVATSGAHLQFGLRVLLLKDKHLSISGQDVERAPLCHHVDDVIEGGAVGDELVVQIVDGQQLLVRRRSLPATKVCPEEKQQ